MGLPLTAFAQSDTTNDSDGGDGVVAVEMSACAQRDAIHNAGAVGAVEAVVGTSAAWRGGARVRVRERARAIRERDELFAMLFACLPWTMFPTHTPRPPRRGGRGEGGEGGEGGGGRRGHSQARRRCQEASAGRRAVHMSPGAGVDGRGWLKCCFPSKVGLFSLQYILRSISMRCIMAVLALTHVL